MYVCVCMHVWVYMFVWCACVGVRGVKVMKLKEHHTMKGNTEILRNGGWMKLTNHMWMGRRLLRRGSEQGMERAVDTEHQWNHCIYENDTIKSIIKCVNWKQKKRTNKIRNPTKLFFKQILLDPGQLHCSQPCSHLPASYSHRSRAGSREELFLKQQKQQTVAKTSRRPFCTYWNDLWFYLLTLFHFAWGEVLGIKPTALQNTLFFINGIGHINRLS